MGLISWIRRKLSGSANVGRSTNLEYYRNLYSTMVVLEKHKPAVKSACDRIKKNQKRYELAAEMIKKAHDLNVNWKIIACIHSLEASGDFDKQILCGQPWTQKTTITPKGKGPWQSWELSCVDAFVNERWESVNFNDIGSILYAVERYNGLGFASKGKNSAYLWSFSNHGLGVGRYVADGRYSSTSVSQQVGWSLIYKGLENA